MPRKQKNPWKIAEGLAKGLTRPSRFVSSRSCRTTTLEPNLVAIKLLRSPPDSPQLSCKRHKEQSRHQGIGRARLCKGTPASTSTSR